MHGIGQNGRRGLQEPFDWRRAGGGGGGICNAVYSPADILYVHSTYPVCDQCAQRAEPPCLRAGTNSPRSLAAPAPISCSSTSGCRSTCEVSSGRWAVAADCSPPPPPPPPLSLTPPGPPSPARSLLYWTVADGAGQRSAFDALSDALACMGSVSPARWSAQASLLRAAAAAAPRGTEDPQAARAAPGAEGAALHRVSFSDEPGQLFLLSRCVLQRRACAPEEQHSLAPAS